MFLRFIFISTIYVSSSFAFLITENSFTDQQKILKRLDIDTSFLNDPTLFAMKNQVNFYRTQHFLKGLERGYQFVPILRQMIAEAGIPDVFLYLAMAESNFSATAFSSAKAVGLWQFMPYTGKKFGLRIDDYVDERRDPIKSTTAAITYLQTLHAEFGKWYLAAMAYNCGEGRVRRAIREAGTDELKILLDPNKKYLPLETRTYIRKILTMAHLSNNPEFVLENESDHLLNQGSSQTYSPVEVPGGTTLEDVARSMKISENVLKGYNPHLRYFFTPPNQDTYTIYIPYDKKPFFTQNFVPSKQSNQFIVHVVKSGDSLYALGKKYGVSHTTIKDFNKLKNNNLKLKQKLIVPIIKNRKTQSVATNGKKEYTIKNGDTLIAISKKFNVSVNSLKKANNLTSNNIRVGAKIAIP